MQILVYLSLEYDEDDNIYIILYSLVADIAEPSMESQKSLGTFVTIF